MTDTPLTVSTRAVIGPVEFDRLIAEFRMQLIRRIQRKGDRCLISRHEVLGVVAEEYVELCEAVHSNIGVREELWDVAIAATVGVASIDGGVEW